MSVLRVIVYIGVQEVSTRCAYVYVCVLIYIYIYRV